jgi:hypothetical protein
MVHANADPAGVGVQAVDPIRNRLAPLRVDEAIDAYLGSLALEVPLAPGELEAVHQLLLRLQRDDRLAPLLEVPYTCGNVLKCVSSGLRYAPWPLTPLWLGAARTNATPGQAGQRACKGR